MIAGLAACGAAGEGARAPQGAEIREAAGPLVCLVSVDGPLGLPVARANGFLLGNGKFAVTELAAVASPGATHVTLRFRDGTVCAAKEFGLADPALGLVLLKVGEPDQGDGGLALSTVPTTSGASDAVILGWRHGQDQVLVRARIYNGIASGDLANRLKVEPPKAAVGFYGVEGTRPDVLAGAPILDAEGGVAGVLLQIPGSERAIVVPAGALRNALLAAEPQLKPLAALPKPLWPAMPMPVGKPMAASDFASVMRTIKSKSRCPKCAGKGTISIERAIPGPSDGRGRRQIQTTIETQVCSNCSGEGVVCPDGLYALVVLVAEGAVWLQSAPDVEARVRDAASTGGRDLLGALARVGQRYRTACQRQLETDFGRMADQLPRGLVVYAQVQDTVQGPDGTYLMLTTFGPRTLLAVKADRLTPPVGPDGKRAAVPDVGEWVVLGGVGEGVATIGGRHPVLVRPFGWVPGPRLAGSTPTRPGRNPDSATPGAPEPKAPGMPTFFGL